MSSASLPLKVTLGLVMIASAIELSFISATVAYLAQIGKIAVLSNGQTNEVPGLPANLEVNQGHTSNGAAGTGLIIVGFAGVLALQLRGRPGYHNGTLGGLFRRSWYRLWLVLNVPALLLTLGALAYVFAVTNAHNGQDIDMAVVRGLQDGGKYPRQDWTPQGWFEALGKLEFVSGNDRDDVALHLKLAKGWQYNLIPFFVVQLAHTVLALLDARRRRREEGQFMNTGIEKGVAYVGK